MAGKNILIIDGSSLLFRAFYALPLLSAPDGVFTNAVTGMATMLGKILADEQPDRVAVCFDKSRVSFRTAQYPAYKGTRGETPRELVPQFELVKELLDAMRIAWEEIENYEADDIIGTIAKQSEQNGDNVLILTGDRDELQLIAAHTRVMLTKRGITETEVVDLAGMQDKYGLTPQEFIDLKGLMGDSSDNIPGVPGVGEKTALKLLGQYRSIDNIYANLNSITPPGLQKKLTEHRDLAFLSRSLATICCEVPSLNDLTRYDWPGFDIEALRSFYNRYNMRRLMSQLPAAQPHEAASASNDTPNNTKQNFMQVTLCDATEMAGKFAGRRIALYAMRQGDSLAALGIADDTGVYAAQLHEISDIADLLGDAATPKILFAGKELRVLLARQNITLRGITEDVQLQAYLLDPNSGKNSVAELAGLYGLAVDEPPNADTAQLAGYNASLLWQLQPLFAAKLEEENMQQLYREVELPLSDVLAGMELTGIRVERRTLSDLNVQLSAREAALTGEIYDLAGHSFNINSPKQLGEVLFNQLNLPVIKKTKTGYSTNIDVLEQLLGAHPIIEKIIEYRTITKLRSTYAEGLQQLITPQGRIHTTFNQTVTATGRLSSTEPNLQNIPVREEEGRKLRRAFVADAGGDNVLFSADYSQVELRVLAHIANDDIMLDAFRANQDIHARTAAEVFGVPLNEVTREMRRRAKAVNFGIVYGISDYGLSQDLGISRAEAKEYIEAYLARYTKVAAYMKDIVAVGKQQGYVTTLLGRRRYLPDLNNKNYNLRSFAERMALNTPIQGTAADIIKVAMVNIARSLAESDIRAQMLLQVHDELIFNVAKDDQPRLARLVQNEMIQAAQLSVPLAVDMKTGETWYDMQPYSL